MQKVLLKTDCTKLPLITKKKKKFFNREVKENYNDI